MEILEFLKDYNLDTMEHMEDVLQDAKVPLLVKGCAGSGKTLRFLARIAYLLKSSDMPREHMLNLVYDAETARRMSKAYAEMFGDDEQPLFVDMFSFCYRIVKFYDENNGHAQRKVYRDMEKAAKRILSDTFKQHMHRQDINRLLQQVNECKMRMMSEKEIANITFDGIDFPAFYNAYEKFKKNRKIYDKCDVIHEALHILMYDKEIVDLYRRRFHYFNIDDAQEMSYATHMIVRMLHAQQSSLCAFMDEAQCIDIEYGAQPSIFASWKDYYGDVMSIELTQNHRMNKTISQLAAGFYYKDKNALGAASEEESDIRYKGFAEWKKMYDYALRTIRENPEQTAFLYREGPYAIPLIDTLRRENVNMRYRCNIKKFMNHPVVKDLCNFITLFTDPRSMRAFFEIHERMGLDMSNRILLEIDERIQKDEHVDVYQAVMESGYKSAGKKKLASHMEEIRLVSTQSSFEMVQYVMDKLQYAEYMKTLEIDQDDANVISFKVLCDRYPDSVELMQVLKLLPETESDENADIVISDIASCKGQQFSRVCILDCFAGVYPKPCNSEEEADFERRLFYVAMTRALHHLEFFTSKRCFTTRLEMSPYIYELHGKNDASAQKTKSKSAAAVRRLREGDLKRGAKVLHSTLGEGKILRVKDGMMEVQFASETKMLNVKMCVRNKLVELA